MTPPVSEQITQRSASNLALAFIMLPKAKRAGMSALYAFCREVDDVADEESVPLAERRARLAQWRTDIRTACDGGGPQFPVNRELQPFIVTHRLPFALFDELLRGVEMDLDVTRYETWDELEQYCYRVASVVGLLSIEIFGHTSPACHDYAVHLGKALQLTNILRDVGNDAARGRIYLPLAELKRHEVTEAEILGGEFTPRFRKLAQATAHRARHHYDRARATLPPEDRKAMVAAELMGAVYWRLLRKLEESDFPVLAPTPTKLHKLQKLALILRTWYRSATGALAPNYGV
ncbi:MAG: presqualene diphosphate synthase HpnD [Verrucomicrobia bacterium]|nr:presqualene diphosphate synthase HpnD [Verrucomicrobiota bacterium]